MANLLSDSPSPQTAAMHWEKKLTLRKLLPRLALISCALAVNSGAAAQSILDALDLARKSEPTLLGAKAAGDAARAKSRQALAGLLPQITAGTNTNANNRDYVTRNSLTPPVADSYNSNSRQINVTQPIWRSSNRIALTQADAVVSQSEYQIAAAEQETLARLITAWCDSMYARDSLLFTVRQTSTASQNLEVFRRGLELGTASAPALEEASAKYEQALSERAFAETDLQIKIAALEQLVGPLPSFRAPFLIPTFRPMNMQKGTLETWAKLIEDSSPSVLAAVRALDAATEEIRKQRAGHEPTLDLVGSYSQNSQSVGSFPGQNGYDIKLGTVGVQLNIPLYAGGGQTAKIEEALAMREKARHDLEAARRAARYSMTQAWLGWQVGIARQTASLQAIKSALITIKTASVGTETGLKTEFDLLQAKQQLESARRDLHRARYDLIITSFRLKAVAGILGDEDFVSIHRMFTNVEPESTDIVAAR